MNNLNLLLIGRRCLMDVMYIDLRNVDVCTGRIENDMHLDVKNTIDNDSFKLGSCIIKKSSKSLLTRKCELKLQVERNLESNLCHNGNIYSFYLQYLKIL